MKRPFQSLTFDLTLSSVLNRLIKCGDKYNYLFVACDSARGPSLAESRAGLDRLMLRQGVTPVWSEDGFRIAGEQLGALLKECIIVHFSAVAVFGSDNTNPRFSGYSSTSESHHFSEAVPKELIQAMSTSGALAYLADGVGLNVFCVNDILFNDLDLTQDLGFRIEDVK